MFELTFAQGELLDRHYELLLRWNARMNLTTVTELHEAAVRHYCESIFVAMHVDGGTVADVGSGGGFPGIPVAIVQPGWSVTLIESHQRKAVFLREAARELPNVRVVADRAEAVQGQFDWMISRAVSPLSLSKLTIAKRFAVLCAESDAPALLPSEVLQLPWGASRVLAVGAIRQT